MLGDKDKRAAYDRFGHAGVGGAGGPQFDPSTFADFGESFGGIGDVFGLGESSAAAAGARRTAARIGPPIRPGDHLRTRRQGPRDAVADSARGDVRHLQGQRRRRGHDARAVRTVWRVGTTPLSAGLLHRGAPLRHCRGTGRVIASPCGTCRGAGRVTRERKLTVRIPAGVATGQRLRLTGEGEHGMAEDRRAICTSSSMSPITRFSSAKATTCTARFRCSSPPSRSAAP